MTTVRGNIDVVADVDRVVGGHHAIVNAVTPLRGPQDIESLDPQFFVRTGRYLLNAAMRHGVDRIVLVGHFSNLITESGAHVADDDDMFPPSLRGFSRSHTAGLEITQFTMRRT